MSDRRTLANRTNASKSTGPKTRNGKKIVSGNAEQHGVLSSKLLIANENDEEYQLLHLELQASLEPVGALELSLVERIAINLWRQRRLVAAETAEIDLSVEHKRVAAAVGLELGAVLPGRSVAEDDLQPYDDNQRKWCEAVIEEIEHLEECEVSAITDSAPLLLAQIQSDAEDDDEEPAAYLEGYPGGTQAYLGELLRWCRQEVSRAASRPKLLELADRVRQKKSVLPERTLMLFMRYQTTLDNQMYKALRALREAQEWRLRTIEACSTSAQNAAAKASE